MSKSIWLMVAACFALMFFKLHETKPTNVISAHIGKRFDDVAKDSTYPIKTETVGYQSNPPEPDSTWLSSPVIIQFDDPQHGFTLPPTKFGLVGYNNGKVTTINTSPMLETLPFEELIPLLDHLQETLKHAGWIPRDEDRNTWLQVGNAREKAALQNVLFDHAETVMLLIPRKYMLILNVKCYARCNERDSKTAKYLIDVGVGPDVYNR